MINFNEKLEKKNVFRLKAGNLTFIPVDFHPKRALEFDTHYMNQEFKLAYNLARSGYKWHKYPPGFEPANSPTPPGPQGR